MTVHAMGKLKGQTYALHDNAKWINDNMEVAYGWGINKIKRNGERVVMRCFFGPGAEANAREYFAKYCTKNAA